MMTDQLVAFFETLNEGDRDTLREFGHAIESEARRHAFTDVRGIMEGPSAAVDREYAAGWDACWAYVLEAVDRMDT